MAKKKKKGGNKKAYSMNVSYLERLMKMRGYNQKSLAAQVPCSNQMVHRWVNGKSQITARKLIQLAKALNVDPCALLQGDDARAHNYVRDLINRRIEHDLELMRSDEEDDDLPLLDHATIVQMMKAMAYLTFNMPKDQQFNPEEFNFQRLEAESQMDNLLDIEDDG